MDTSTTNAQTCKQTCLDTCTDILIDTCGDTHMDVSIDRRMGLFQKCNTSRHAPTSAHEQTYGQEKCRHVSKHVHCIDMCTDM